MRILFVTSEVATLYKLGGLGDVGYALPVALHKLGVSVSIAVPYYTAIKIDSHCLGPIAVDFDAKRELVFIFLTKLPGVQVPVYLFRHPFLNDYHSKEMPTNFAFYCKVISHFYLYAETLGAKPFDIVHANDWHTSLVPLILGESNKTEPGRETLESTRTRTILTIHNLLYQGETSAKIIKKLGYSKSRFHLFDTPQGKAIKFLREGLEYVDAITTVSPTYAKEITEHASDVGTVLRKRKDAIVGILNGIDGSLWDPRTDPSLPVNYDIRNVLMAKPKIKAYLRRALHLPEKDVPLFGFVGRLEVRQKGIDILSTAAQRLPQNSFQLVILGTGGKKQVKILTELAERNHHVAFINTFDERLARRIYAGSDIMLVPSKFEPCGLTQIIAMRYGTIPLVRRTGGLADTVKQKITGFVFGPYTDRALAASMKQAISAWEQPKVWRQMIRRAIKEDFSWRKSAKRYRDLYKRVIESG